jgi:GxxExxY protein
MGRPLNKRSTPDFVCFGQIILEINAVKQLCNEARARVHNDLHAARYRLEILVNSAHHAKLEYQRIVL